MHHGHGRMLGRDDLIASHFTLAGAGIGEPARFPFAARVAAAAAAGFSGIGLLLQDYEACRAAGLSAGEMRAILDGYGVQLAELEFLVDWNRGDARALAARQVEELLYGMAEALGARHLVLIDMDPPEQATPRDALAERFAGVCDRAAERGLRVALEFLPWTEIPDVAAAWEVARCAGRANGGILVDAWHYFHGSSDEAQLRSVPGGSVVAVQLDDAGEGDAAAAPFMATLDRELPGQGTLDLAQLLGILDEIGADPPISVEILSPVHSARPLEEAARAAHDAARAVLDGARRARPLALRA